jgi:hypothetical protein
MCPFCIGTATVWALSSGTSAGGIAGFILKRRLAARQDSSDSGCAAASSEQVSTTFRARRATRPMKELISQ